VASPENLETDDTTEASVRVGRTLRDKWHLDALIDVGGMAAVYAATHRNGLRGAVKILHRHRSLDRDIAARFRREGYIANKVAHPNAVRVLDDDVDDDGSVFLVMELLEGTTLRDRAGARGGTLPPDEVLLAVDQLLDVLAVAHDVAIIHRDVKPENVFVTDGGLVKILDFGIARMYEPSGPGHSETVAGLPMGSPAFMSPEQARGRWDLVDAQSDLWSVGATMFNLLSGRDVHVAETVPELLAAIFTEPAPSLATAVTDCHPAMVDLVDRALRLRLADRWQDARAMQVAVRAAYVEMFGARPLSTALTIGTRQRPTPVEIIVGDLTPTRLATTGIAPTVQRRELRRRAALASAFLVAGALGIAGARAEWRPSSPEVAGTVVAELVETPRNLSTTLAPPAPALESVDSPAVPTATSPLASPAPPALRAHRRSAYDRRK
jgi:serine/threonine-protein kinase